MRIIGFSSLEWHNYEVERPKLALPRFTTFRFPRRDRDWTPGEIAKTVYKPRARKDTVRTVLGLVVIISVEPRSFLPRNINGVKPISNREARMDGFESALEMGKWIQSTYGIGRICEQYIINRLSLRWTQRWLYVGPSAEINKQWAEIVEEGLTDGL